MDAVALLQLLGVLAVLVGVWVLAGWWQRTKGGRK